MSIPPIAERTEREALIAAAEACLAEQIAPTLPADARYAAAMLRRTLAILRREAESASTGERTRLAAAIRARSVPADARLSAALMEQVRADLDVNAPEYLAHTDAQIRAIGAVNWVFHPARLAGDGADAGGTNNT